MRRVRREPEFALVFNKGRMHLALGDVGRGWLLKHLVQFPDERDGLGCRVEDVVPASEIEIVRIDDEMDVAVGGHGERVVIAVADQEIGLEQVRLDMPVQLLHPNG